MMSVVMLQPYARLQHLMFSAACVWLPCVMVMVGVPVPMKARVNDSLNILVFVRQVLHPFGTYWIVPFASIVTKAVPFTVFIEETEYVTLPCGCTASLRQKALHRFSTMRAAYC